MHGYSGVWQTEPVKKSGTRTPIVITADTVC
jgi:hypothetical protein